MNYNARFQSLFLVTFEEFVYLFLGLFSKVVCDMLTSPAVEIVPFRCHARDEYRARPWNGQREGFFWRRGCLICHGIAMYRMFFDGVMGLFHGMFTTCDRSPEGGYFRTMQAYLDLLNHLLEHGV